MTHIRCFYCGSMGGSIYLKKKGRFIARMCTTCFTFLNEGGEGASDKGLTEQEREFIKLMKKL